MENPLCSQPSMSAAASASSRRVRLKKADQAAADPLGDRGQVGRVDRAGGQLFSAGGFAFAPPARELAARHTLRRQQAARRRRR